MRSVNINASTRQEMLAAGALNLLPQWFQWRFGGGDRPAKSPTARAFPESTLGSRRALDAQFERGWHVASDIEAGFDHPRLAALDQDPMTTGRDVYSYYLQPNITGSAVDAEGETTFFNVAPLQHITSSTPLNRDQLKAKAKENIVRMAILTGSVRYEVFTSNLIHNFDDFELNLLGVFRGM